MSELSAKPEARDMELAPTWLGWLDSNQRNAGVKVPCLTTWLHPNMGGEPRAGADAPALSLSMGWVMGLEPTTPGTTIRCSAS